MKRCSNFHLLAIVLCVLALIAASTAGSKAGYFCLCGDTPTLTPAAFCYGPHGDHCAKDEAQGGGSTGDDGSGDRRDHQVVKQEVQSRPLEIVSKVAAPQVLLGVLPMLETFSPRLEVKVPVVHPVDFGESPPFGVTVARTVVLRI